MRRGENFAMSDYVKILSLPNFPTVLRTLIFSMKVSIGDRICMPG